MSGNVKGITIEFRGDTTKLDQAIKQVDKETKKTDDELKKVNKDLKFNPTSVDLWKQKQTLLTDKINQTQDKLSSLKEAQKKLDADKSVDKNSAEYRDLQREIIETESKLKTFKGQLKQIGNYKLKALGEQFKQIGGKLKAVGKGMTTYATLPLVAIGAASVKTGMEFDKAMAQVAATMGKTVDEIRELRDFAIQMGSTTAFSSTQAAEGLNYMALAGYDAEQAMAMLPTVLNLAAAGAMELGAASDMVTDAQTALGLSGEETTAMVDQMAQAASKSNTSVTQLGEAILKIGPNAKSLAGGTEELNTVLGLLADNGIKGSEAGTHLRNILLSMNTEKVKDAFHEMGVEIYDAEGNMRSLSDIFPELSTAMEGLTSEERNGMIAKLFNKTDLAAVNSLLDTSADRWEELGLAIGDAGGAAEKMAETQLDDLDGSIILLKSALEGARIAISDVLSPYIRKLADLLSALVVKFTELNPGIRTVIVAVGAIVAAIGPLLVIVGTLMSAVGTIMPMLAGITAPMVAIAAGIAALAVVIGTALAKSEPFRNAMATLGKTLVSVFLPVIKQLVSTFKQLFSIIGETVTEVANDLSPVIVALTPIITKIAKLIASHLIGKLKAFIGIVKLVSLFVKAFAKGIAAAFQAISMKGLAMYNKIRQIFSKIKTAMTGPFEAAKSKIKSIIDAIKGFFNNVKLSAPKVPLPHFKIKPAGWDIGDLVKGKIPSLSVDWYAKGGIFNRPTVLTGVGEAGPEAVVPLNTLWQKLDNIALAAASGNLVINNYGDANPYSIAQEVKRVLINEVKRGRQAWQ